jgi:hypothetical protein
MLAAVVSGAELLGLNVMSTRHVKLCCVQSSVLALGLS